MALQEFLQELDQLVTEAKSSFSDAADMDALEASRIEFLGAKNGRLKSAQKMMGGIDKPDKPEAGKTFNAT